MPASVSTSVKGARFYCLPSTAVSLRTGCRAGTSTPTCSWVHTSCRDTQPGVWVRVIPGASWYVHTWPHFVSPETGSESRIWGQVVYLGGGPREVTTEGQQREGSARGGGAAVAWSLDMLCFTPQLCSHSHRDQGARDEAGSPLLTPGSACLCVPAPPREHTKGTWAVSSRECICAYVTPRLDTWGESPCACSCTCVCVCASCVCAHVCTRYGTGTHTRSGYVRVHAPKPLTQPWPWLCGGGDGLVTLVTG